MFDRIFRHRVVAGIALTAVLSLAGFAVYFKHYQDLQKQAKSYVTQQIYQRNCASCHGDDGQGTAEGPNLAKNPRVAVQSVPQLRAFLEKGNVASGMPAFSNLPNQALTALAKYLRRINEETLIPNATEGSTRDLTWGPPKSGDWLTYNGDQSGNRYSLLKQIEVDNVSSLNLKWVFPIQHFGLETTPLAADGVLFVTGPNQVIALDGTTGAELWNFSRPATSGTVGDAKLGTNRGVAISGGLVYFLTDNAHLLALSRANGNLIWETPLAPNHNSNYGGTMAPLVVNHTVIAGVAGADQGIRGFVAAFDAESGVLVWRHWTVPAAGEPGIESWNGKDPVTGGGSTWLTGSYDPASDTLFWPTGNPWPDSDDRQRPGDNLYTNCVIALDAKSGKLKWHYQFTPHDLLDRDATEPMVLADTTYQGRPAKLLLHADRNGFFYALDRITGKVLMAKPFLRRIDWASGIGPDGRPVVNDGRGCPSDAANWDSTAYSPTTRLYYLLALEECGGNSKSGYPEQNGQRYLRALSIDTGKIVWEVPQPGPARAKTWSGVLATAGGLIFYGQPNGGFSAVDERNGHALWRFPTNVRMKASPMTFTAKGRQYVAVAAGPNILCFGI